MTFSLIVLVFCNSEKQIVPFYDSNDKQINVFDNKVNSIVMLILFSKYGCYDCLKQLIDSLKFKNKATYIVLPFTENVISRKNFSIKLIRDFKSIQVVFAKSNNLVIPFIQKKIFFEYSTPTLAIVDLKNQHTYYFEYSNIFDSEGLLRTNTLTSINRILEKGD